MMGLRSLTRKRFHQEYPEDADHCEPKCQRRKRADEHRTEALARHRL